MPQNKLAGSLGLTPILSLLLLSACAADDADVSGDDSVAAQPETADDVLALEEEDIRAALAELGFDPSAAHIEGENVSVGDVGFERSKLLSGEYGQSSSPDESRPKAHYVGGTPLYWLNSVNIKIAWSTNAADAPTQAVKDAVVNAAGDFNATCNGSPSCLIEFSQNNTGPTVTVHLTPVANWPPAACAGQTNIVGCAKYPSGGNPGADIYFKAGTLSTNCSAWTTSALAHTARHEMMHVLGFRHKGDGTLVPNTLANPATTVMTGSSNFVVPGCTLSPTLLQTDDKAGLRNLPIDTSI